MADQRPYEELKLGGKIFRHTLLNVFDSRKIFLKSQRLLSVFTDPESEAWETGPIMLAAFAGGLDEDLEALLVTTFGGTTMVRWEDEDRELSLGGSNAKHNLDQVFAGNFSHLYMWLDFCMKTNFKDVIAKMKADSAKGREKAAALKEASQ